MHDGVHDRVHTYQRTLVVPTKVALGPRETGNFGNPSLLLSLNDCLFSLVEDYLVLNVSKLYSLHVFY
jgi:hypothetical protein